MSNCYKAIARNIAYSPYKLRLLVDTIRDKNVEYALRLLSMYNNQRSVPIKKVLESALANARYKNCNDDTAKIFILEIRVNQGAIRKYFKPGAQGRAVFQRHRYCHISVIIGDKKNKIDDIKKVNCGK